MLRFPALIHDETIFLQSHGFNRISLVPATTAIISNFYVAPRCLIKQDTVIMIQSDARHHRPVSCATLHINLCVSHFLFVLFSICGIITEL
jgi:hypothetical protein